MSALRHSAVTVFGRAAAAAVGLGSVCIYTRLLDPASVGIYALLLSSSLLAGGIGFAWLRNALLRVMSGAPEGEMEPDVAATVAIAFAVTAVVVGVLEATFLHVFRPDIPLASVGLATLAALAAAWNDLNSSLLQARLRFVAWGVLNFARAVVALGATVALIHAGLTSDALLGGFVLGNCASLACAGAWRSALRGSFDGEFFRKMVRFGWPLSVKGGFEQIAPTAARYIIDYSIGATAVGLYAVATDFTAQISASIVGSVSLAGIPLAFRAKDRGGATAAAEQMANNARLIVAVAAPLSIGMIVLANPIASVFFGPRFRTGAEIVIALVVVSALLVNVRTYYFDQVFELAFRTRPQALIAAVVMFVAIASYLVFVPRYGSVGAALGGLVGSTVGIVMSAWWGRSLARVPLPLRSWSKSVFASFVMAAVLVEIPKHGGIVELVSLSILGAIVYASASAALRLQFVRSTLVRRAAASAQI